MIKICRGCDEPITGDGAVYLGHIEAASGPGWSVWVHPGHEHLVQPDPDAVRILARVLIAKALRAAGS